MHKVYRGRRQNPGKNFMRSNTMKKSFIAIFILIAILFSFNTINASEKPVLSITKHKVKAPVPFKEPNGSVTPDGSFNIRDPKATFYSDKLADAMMLDEDGKDESGNFLDLNNAIYTVYKLAGDNSAPDTIIVLMPGTWAGAMSMDPYARDLLRLADESGRKGLQVWLHDRRSEQLEDHSGLRYAAENPDGLSKNELIQAMSDYYKPAFKADEEGKELFGRKLTALDQDSVRFMANWGADVAIRDWRAVVLQANRQVGNEVTGTEVEKATVTKKPGRHVFIGGHSLGGSLTVLYSAYDFDRRPGYEILGRDDVSGLIQLEGGRANHRETDEMSYKKYFKKVEKKYKDGMVYFDLDVLGIQYAPQTMMSVGIMGWAAENARGQKCVFPEYSRPKAIQHKNITNEGVLGYAMDDDTSLFFIARTSIGHPTGNFGRNGQLRNKTITVPVDPNECKIITTWKPGHRQVDEDYLYDWENIYDSAYPSGKKTIPKECVNDDPEVTDIYVYARSLYGSSVNLEESTWPGTGPNDFPEWYFPPRLSSESRYIGTTIADEDGTEFMNAIYINDLDLPVISFVGDDSMGQRTVPERSDEFFVEGALAWEETQAHNLIGYTHLDITSATRNNQPDLVPRYTDYNGPAVYSFKFIQSVKGVEK